MLKHFMTAARNAFGVLCLALTGLGVQAQEPKPVVKNSDWLGVHVMDLSAGERKALGIPATKGAVVLGVYPDSPADRGGLRSGDVIVSINADAISTAEHVATWQRRLRSKNAEALKFREKAAASLKKTLAELEKELGPVTTIPDTEATVEYERAGRRKEAVLKAIPEPENLHAATFLLAESGEAWAQYEIARKYRIGDGTAIDHDKARYWMEQAASKGVVAARSDLAFMRITGEGGTKEVSKGLQELAKIASDGATSTQYQLGKLYYEGLHVKRDFAAAAKWLVLAAETGDSRSQLLVAIVYDSSVPPNHADALKWLRKAAEQNVVEAQGLIGVHYQNGWGVEKSDAEALKHFSRAANAGHVPSQYTVGVISRDGLGVGRSLEVAFAWFELAAKNGDGRAQNELGQMYEKGQGVTANRDEAMKWYQKAAKQGHAGAKANLKRLGG